MSTKVTYKRSNPFINYLMLLGTCVGCYLLYFSLIVPIVEVTNIVERRNEDVNDYPQVAEDTDHHQWFQDGDWEKLPCSVLRTAHGKILFDDYTRNDPKTWLVHPFTMILDREPEPGTNQPLPPLILRCADGARLHFSTPFSGLGGGGSNFQLQSAQLEGFVELYRKVPGSTLEEDVRIETSNIQINDTEIMSIDDVVFRFGNNHGVGRNLIMKLSHSATGNSVNQNISSIDGITNLRLGILSSMLLKPGNKNRVRDDRMLSNDKSPVEITSSGPFEFDFHSNLARFIDKVQVRKLDSSGDTLNCDELLLQFAKDPTHSSIELDAANNQEFELENIVALGSPAVLQAKSQNAIVRGQSLDYDLDNQVVTVSGKENVEILKDSDRFVSHSIRYQISNDKRLGNLDADGPGQLSRDNGNDSFSASWSRRLTIRRQSDQQHLIQLKGRGNVVLDEETTLSAEEINLVVREIPVLNSQREVVRWTHQPEQLKAFGTVHVSSEKLIADSNTLLATWPKDPQSSIPVIEKLSSRNSDDRLPNMSYNGTYTSFYQTKRPVYQDDPKVVPVMATSQTIQVSISNTAGKTEFSEVNLLNDVIVRKPLADNQQKSEFEIYGDSLQLEPTGEKLFRVKVSAENKNVARLVSQKLMISGPELFLDQSKNSMWVKGKGRVKINGNFPQPQIGKTSDDVDVSFSGGMIFDGRQVYFEQGVVANIQQLKSDSISITRASGTALRIILDRQIELNQLEKSNSSQGPQILKMEFHRDVPQQQARFQLAGHRTSPAEPVLIRNIKQDVTGKTIEKLTLISRYAKMDETKNELTALGPGSIQIYRQGEQGRGPKGLGFVRTPVQTRGKSLTYIHTNFDRQLIADQVSNEISIIGNLRSIYSPVTSFDQQFNPDQPGKLPEGAIRLNCERIDLIQSRNPLSPEPTSQFIASGRAHINSETIDTIADRISYQDETEILTVESTTGKNVILKVRRDARSAWDQIAGEELVYRVSDGTARIRKVGNASAIIGN